MSIIMFKESLQETTLSTPTIIRPAFNTAFTQNVQKTNLDCFITFPTRVDEDVIFRFLLILFYPCGIVHNPSSASRGDFWSINLFTACQGTWQLSINAPINKSIDSKTCSYAQKNQSRRKVRGSSLFIFSCGVLA